MTKISSEQVKTVLAEASSVIRDLVSTNQELEVKLASFMKKDRCEKIARDMQEKGIYVELDFNEKVAHLLEKDNDKLETIENAVAFQPELSKIASVDSKISNESNPLLKLAQYFADN